MWSALTRMTRCRYCDQTIHLALCFDGRRRPFALSDHPAGVPGVWAWHRGQGMRETDLSPGYRLHDCREFAETCQPGSPAEPGTDRQQHSTGHRLS